jgi:transposase-like protein
MSETKTCKVHTPEYKAKVALQVLRSDKTINEIGQEFQIS